MKTSLETDDWSRAPARLDRQLDHIDRKVNLLTATGCALVACGLTAWTIDRLGEEVIGEIVGGFVGMIAFLFCWAKLHRKSRSRRAHRPF